MKSPFTFFAKSKVSNLYIALCIQKQVIQLQISANYRNIFLELKTY